MGVLRRFEQRLEGLVNGTFARVFKSEVQPVEIAGALQRECDNNATIWNRDRTMVPNDFVVELSPHDYERLSPYAVQLGGELAGMVQDYARQQRYSFVGPVEVHLEKADDLDTGLYRVRSQTLAGSSSERQAPAASPQWGPQAPGAGGYPAPPPMPPQPPGVGPGQVRQLPGTAPVGQTGTRRWVEINGMRHELTRPVMVMGRSTEADLRIDDPSVSRKHAELRVGSPSMVLDLGSTNGIVVDGQHTQRATLRDGSRIIVGSTTIVYRQIEG
ncbi:FhaA domain-containing protein [Allostreptomyces psammosilenae]|uniref:FHA domain-containing protein n=1 Tax=Allostreptomyces psammosilenae TaxID=1892865 RepID=A0A852ZSJ7_9ACTN|nr:DUF3662 and FHA domain-containing protein [Allostreptomyces psammosilenae]NYI05373.1 hypothetical protein [Allostreptomyces psammosilenae]